MSIQTHLKLANTKDFLGALASLLGKDDATAARALEVVVRMIGSKNYSATPDEKQRRERYFRSHTLLSHFATSAPHNFLVQQQVDEIFNLLQINTAVLDVVSEYAALKTENAELKGWIDAETAVKRESV